MSKKSRRMKPPEYIRNHPDVTIIHKYIWAMPWSKIPEMDFINLSEEELAHNPDCFIANEGVYIINSESNIYEVFKTTLELVVKKTYVRLLTEQNLMKNDKWTQEATLPANFYKEIVNQEIQRRDKHIRGNSNG